MDYGKQNYVMLWKMKLYNVKVLIVCMLGILVGCQGKGQTSRVDSLPYYQDAMFTPVWLENKSAFADGSFTIRSAFMRLVLFYGIPENKSIIQQHINHNYLPIKDIIGKKRKIPHTIGAFSVN